MDILSRGLVAASPDISEAGLPFSLFKNTSYRNSGEKGAYRSICMNIISYLATTNEMNPSTRERE